MRKLCLQFISAFVTLNPKCRKAVPVFILAFALSSICYTGFAQVVITPAAGGANICSSTALAGGSPSSCTTLGSITITETNNNDFPPGSSTIVLNPPTGWQFCTGTTPVATFLPGQDISTVTVTPPPFTSTSLTINVTTTGITHHDAITITGLMVQPLTTSAPPGYIYATSVTGAIVGISTGPGPGTSDFGDLSEIPGNISGTPSVCFGFTDTLTSCPAGGIWASSNGAVATVLAGTGCTAVVTSHSAGAITITHTVLGCSTTLNFNVYSNPPPITGLHPHMCAWYDTLTAMDSLGGTGGIFSSTLVTVDNLPTSGPFDSGKVHANAPGIATVVYTALSSGCMTTYTITVDPLPAPISGPFVVCEGSSITLSDPTGGGSWSSGSPGIAAIGSGSGIVSGIITGSTFTDSSLITYAIPGGFSPIGCVVDTEVYVTPLPGPITALMGTAEICSLSTVHLADPTPGGLWSSVTSSVASIVPVPFVGSDTAVVTGISAGTSLISYTLDDGCATTLIITVDPLPAPIMPAVDSVCAGDSILLSDATGGGVWTATPAATGTVDPAGWVTGIDSGKVYITYTIMPGSCIARDSVIVSPLPAHITGADSVCVAGTITLSDSTPSLSPSPWSVVNTTIAYIDSSGKLTGFNTGTDTVFYRLNTGCNVSFVVTVNPLPSPITGPDSVCVGDTITLDDATVGGRWHAFPIGPIDSITGVLAGVSPGVETVTYTLSTGCSAGAFLVTVNAIPSPITGGGSVCVGFTDTLYDLLAGGTWSSTSPLISIVNFGTEAVVTGLAAGSPVVTYTGPGGCPAYFVINVNPLTDIFGPHTVCQGDSISLSDSTSGSSISGGVWTLSNYSLVSYHSTSGGGSASFQSIEVIGLLPGVDTVTYTLPVTGCATTYTITVNPISPILYEPDSAVCVGDTIVLFDGTFPGGGAWSSTNPGIAGTSGATATTVFITGVSAGIDTIQYTMPTGCTTEIPVTVDPVPAPITGPGTVCVGDTIQLTDATAFGAWSVSDSADLWINDSSGLVAGLHSGLDTVYYTIGPISCRVQTTITINPLSPIQGPDTVCAGSSVFLEDTTLGGTWSVTNTLINDTTGVATTSTGSTVVINGITAGVDSILYTITATGCRTYLQFTVNPLPTIMPGIDSVCVGSTVILKGLTSGGTWSVSNGNASIDTVGGTNDTLAKLMGILPGFDTVTYTLHPTGCPISIPVTVNFTPNAIIGDTTVCIGRSGFLYDPSAGGFWTNKFPLIVSNVVDADTTFIHGLSLGVDSIFYTLPTGACQAGIAVTVEPIPVITVTLSQPGMICLGASDTLTASGAGPDSTYTWIPSFGLSATTGATVVASPTLTTTYTVTGTSEWGCDSFTTVTVIIDSTFLHLKVTGRDSICDGETDTLMASGRDSTYFNWYPILSILGANPADTIVVDPIVTTTYTGIAIDDLGCKDSVVFKVTVNPVPIIQVTPTPSILCYGTPLQLFATTTNTNNATTKFSWSPNIFISNDSVYNPIFDDTTNLVYRVIATSIYGCYDSFNVKISVLDTNVNTISLDTNICIGGSAQLVAISHSVNSNLDVPTYTWTPNLWLNNPDIYDPVATPDTTTTYSVFVRENACFDTTMSVTVFVQPYPQISITLSSDSANVIAGTPVQITATVENTPVKYYVWAPANTLSCDSCLNPVAIPSVTTTYVVTVSSIYGCVSEDSVTLILNCDNSQIFIPNTFTPNGDGINDRFFVSGKGIGLITLFQVYNRWGQMVFEAQNIPANQPSYGWDGTFKGVVLEPDVFVYIVHAVCELGNTVFKYKGDISIVK